MQDNLKYYVVLAFLLIYCFFFFLEYTYIHKSKVSTSFSYLFQFFLSHTKKQVKIHDLFIWPVHKALPKNISHAC